MRQKKLSKKVDKLEKKAEKLAAKASAKGGELAGKAQVKGKDLSDRAAIKMGVKEEPKTSSRKGLFALVATAAAGLGFFLKRKREQELDEALWEEPRAL